MNAEVVFDEAMLSAAFLRQRFLRCDSFEWTGEFPLSDQHAGAAVLIPIVQRDTKLTVLLTRRTEHLYHHPGQISFPGGRIEEQDETPVDTALRETQEEIGLPPEKLEVLGTLPAYATSTGFQVTPVVALVQPPFALWPDSFEVAEIFEVPLSFVVNATNYQTHRVQRLAGIVHFHAVPWGGRFIWGATAGMLAMLSAFIRGASQWPSRG